MPRKKSNLDNACSRKARLQRALRARESEEETAARNAAQRIRTAEIRRQEYQEQHDKRLQQNYLPEPSESLEYVNYCDSKDSVLEQLKKEFPEDECLQSNCSINSKIVPENKELLKVIDKQEVKRENTEEGLSINIKEEDDDIVYQFTLKTQRLEDQDILGNAGVTSVHYDVLATPQEVRCKLCHKTFKNIYNLIKHNNEHVTIDINIPVDNQINGVHQCRYCNQYLDSHDMDVNSETNSKCEKCEEKFKNAPNFERETLPLRKLKNSPNEFLSNKLQFNYCDIDSKPKNRLNNHLNLCSTSKKDRKMGYKCDTCGRVFKNKKILTSHTKRVHYDYGRMFECWCGKQFRTPMYLCTHKKIQHPTKAKKYKCKSCDAIFTKKIDLVRHIKRKHYDYGRMFECWCGKQFRTPINLNQHKRRQHENSIQSANNKFQCDICQKIFRVKKDLVIHIKRMHYDYGRMFECCGKLFRTPFHLKEHKERQHECSIQSDNKKFQCDICQKIFRVKKNFVIHIKRMHHDYGRMFECWCGKQFRSPMYLNDHKVRQHESSIQIANNKFQCDSCQKIFRVKKRLLIHIKRNHYDYGRMFECWCRKKFRTPMHLSDHKRRRHNPVYLKGK